MNDQKRSKPNDKAGERRDPACHARLTPVQRFVSDAADALGLERTASDLRTRRLLVRLTSWATNEGIALQPELIFDPDTVERFVEVGLAADRSRATYRAVLRSVAPKLTRRAPWEPRPIAIARRSLAPPYTDEEVALLHVDAREQPTARKRTAARAFLALGLGAGLDGRWISKVRATDVELRNGAVLVRVGEPSDRSVVVRAAYEEDVIDLARTADAEFLVGGTSRSANRTGLLAASLAVPTGHPRIAPSRLRSTWLLDHVRSGTRLPELCRAAGIRGPAVVGGLLDLVLPMEPDDETTMLRGGPR